MRYIFVDTDNRRIREVEGPEIGSGKKGGEKLSNIFIDKHIGGRQEFIHAFDNADMLYTSESVALGKKKIDRCFYLSGERIPYLFFGNAMICGMSEDGRNAPATSSIKEVEKVIKFMREV